MSGESPKAPSFGAFKPASPTSSRTKQKVRSRGTKAEMMLRRELWSRGRRYRTHLPIPGKPDIAFRKAQVAVFCDGDFFHGRDWPLLRSKLERRANADYWVEKIAYNRERDTRVNEKLRQLGWRVLRFWETDILADVKRVADEVDAVLLRDA